MQLKPQIEDSASDAGTLFGSYLPREVDFPRRWRRLARNCAAFLETAGGKCEESHLAYTASMIGSRAAKFLRGPPLGGDRLVPCFAPIGLRPFINSVLPG